MSQNAYASHQEISNSFTIFCSELETNNTGHLDFTNNSGVQDPLLQTPQAMAHESNQSKVPFGCLPYGKGYNGLVSKGSRPGSQATGLWRFNGFKIQPCEFTKTCIHQRFEFIQYSIELIETCNSSKR